MPNPPQIFISYAREDYRVVRKLYDRLKAAGYKPWMDGDSRVLRGGSFILNSRYCRAAYRLNNSPGGHNDLIGFRCVISVRTP